MEVRCFDGMKVKSRKVKCHTFEDAEKLLKECALKPLANVSFNWDYEEFPSLDVDVNGGLAKLCYVDNQEHVCYGRFGAELSFWISLGSHEGKVSFLCGEGNRTKETDGRNVVTLEQAIECVKRFYEDGELPECIEWDRIT